MRDEKEKAEAIARRPSVAFDLHDWHDGPACRRTVCSGYLGIGVYIACTTCGCVANVEATGRRMLIEDSFAPYKGGVE